MDIQWSSLLPFVFLIVAGAAWYVAGFFRKKK